MGACSMPSGGSSSLSAPSFRAACQTSNCRRSGADGGSPEAAASSSSAAEPPPQDEPRTRGDSCIDAGSDDRSVPPLCRAIVALEENIEYLCNALRLVSRRTPCLRQEPSLPVAKSILIHLANQKTAIPYRKNNSERCVMLFQRNV